jgi:hypothetical protein
MILSNLISLNQGPDEFVLDYVKRFRDIEK